jgi:hypothetical protein
VTRVDGRAPRRPTCRPGRGGRHSNHEVLLFPPVLSSTRPCPPLPFPSRFPLPLSLSQDNLHRLRPPRATPRPVSSFPRPRAPRPLFLCRFPRLFISPLSLPPCTGAGLEGSRVRLVLVLVLVLACRLPAPMFRRSSSWLSVIEVGVSP